MEKMIETSDDKPKPSVLILDGAIPENICSLKEEES